MSYNTNKTTVRRGQGPAQTQSMGSAGTGSMAASGETARWGRPHEYCTAPITRCVLNRRRELAAFFWFLVDMALLFAVAAALAYLVLVRWMAPEWLACLEPLESAAQVVTREVRP